MTTYALVLDAFPIEFDVREEISISETSARHYPDAPDFVYAVADIWVVVDKVRYLVISMFDTGNLIETLGIFRKKLHSISVMPSLTENIKLPRGGWGSWMEGYWDRIDKDCSLSDDEENYDLLIACDLISGKDGRFCAYLYDGVPTLEVATRTESRGASINAWCTFDLEKLAFEVEKLQHSISLEIRERGKRN
jgi:hypothetical protein